MVEKVVLRIQQNKFNHNSFLKSNHNTTFWYSIQRKSALHPLAALLDGEGCSGMHKAKRNMGNTLETSASVSGDGKSLAATVCNCTNPDLPQKLVVPR